MLTKNILRYFVVIAAASIVITSCKKEKDDEIDKDTSVAADNALAQRSFDDVKSIADEAASGSLSSFLSPSTSQERMLLSSCATITHDTVSVPRTLTINFGSTNCLCNDGRYRRGIINVSYTGGYRDSASVHTITFTNYYVNDHQLLGTKTVTNMGHNASGNLHFSVSVNGQMITADGRTINWTSNRDREWILGESTPTRFDDVYLITGTASGSSSTGNSFTATTISPLRYEVSCHHLVSGSLSITPSSKPVRTVDFGSGSCDNQATVTINGNVYTITLH
jgi:hypothetical protein